MSSRSRKGEFSSRLRAGIMRAAIDAVCGTLAVVLSAGLGHRRALLDPWLMTAGMGIACTQPPQKHKREHRYKDSSPNAHADANAYLPAAREAGRGAVGRRRGGSICWRRRSARGRGSGSAWGAGRGRCRASGRCSSSAGGRALRDRLVEGLTPERRVTVQTLSWLVLEDVVRCAPSTGTADQIAVGRRLCI